MDEINWLKLIKWILIVLIAGFIGQFGKMLANHFIAKARFKKKREEKQLMGNAAASGSETKKEIGPGSMPAEETAKEREKIEKKKIKALEKQKKKELKNLEKKSKK
ncbi:MAG: hypothetical protein M0P57_00585 [Syntrophales bacterium]|jgi:hypothetical protein|nr:hypothetical protein [Syntrophales bacterium]MDY0043683.1 hypothetical protein [Syntrophales bacterium]